LADDDVDHVLVQVRRDQNSPVYCKLLANAGVRQVQMRGTIQFRGVDSLTWEVADSPKQAADLIGTSPKTLSSALSGAELLPKKYQVYVFRPQDGTLLSPPLPVAWVQEGGERRPAFTLSAAVKLLFGRANNTILARLKQLQLQPGAPTSIHVGTTNHRRCLGTVTMVAQAHVQRRSIQQASPTKQASVEPEGKPPQDTVLELQQVKKGGLFSAAPTAGPAALSFDAAPAPAAAAPAGGLHSMFAKQAVLQPGAAASSVGHVICAGFDDGASSKRARVQEPEAKPPPGLMLGLKQVVRATPKKKGKGKKKTNKAKEEGLAGQNPIGHYFGY
jgi:hypothetical protein